MSGCTCWKYQTYAPVLAFKAIIEAQNRLSLSRIRPVVIWRTVAGREVDQPEISRHPSAAAGSIVSPVIEDKATESRRPYGAKRSLSNVGSVQTSSTGVLGSIGSSQITSQPSARNPSNQFNGTQKCPPPFR